jgi:hypothetical protein
MGTYLSEKRKKNVPDTYFFYVPNLAVDICKDQQKLHTYTFPNNNHTKKQSNLNTTISFMDKEREEEKR